MLLERINPRALGRAVELCTEISHKMRSLRARTLASAGLHFGQSAATPAGIKGKSMQRLKLPKGWQYRVKKVDKASWSKMPLETRGSKTIFETLPASAVAPRCAFFRNIMGKRCARMPNDKWANPQKMWDERFSQHELIYGEKPNAFLAEQSSRFSRGMKLLVPADGYGRNGIWLAKQGFNVHTVDLSPIGVERARKAALAAGANLPIEQADLTTWNWPAKQFDGVLAIFLHLAPSDRTKVHASMLRTAKPGGLIILEAFSPAQLQHNSGGPKQVELLYTAEMLRQDFASADPLLLEEKETHISEGYMHSGSAAVVRAVFRK